MKPRQAFLSGTEITDYVMDWGELDEIKSVMLAQDQMFTGQVKLKMANVTGIFSPDNPCSIMHGQQEMNQEITIFLNGVQVFGGVLKTCQLDHDARTSTLIIENQFSNLATTLAVVTASGVNPVIEILELLLANGSAVNAGSFLSAAGPSLAAGATISLTLAASDQTYLLDLINSLAELASVTVFVQNAMIYCTAWQPYQGDGSNLRQPITDSVVRTWGTRETAYNTFYNQVIVPYGSSSLTLDNLPLQALAKTVSSYTLQVSSVSIPDKVSAIFWGTQYLNRSSAIRDKINIKVGIEMADAVIGNRYPVTCENYGYNSKAFEVIETKKTLLDKGMELVLASL